MTLIKLRELDVSFKNKIVLQQIDLSIEQGEIFVLMGKSGCGKSTLLRTINGLQPISKGSVDLKQEQDWIDIQACSAKILRQIRAQRIAMVFQQASLLPWKNVWDNCAIGLRLQSLDAKELKNRCDFWLSQVGLWQHREAFPHQLSGGMQQRLGIARALAMQTDVILMDEPFSALDMQLRATLQEELLKLHEKYRKTIVFVTHDAREAIILATRIGILHQKKIVQIIEPQSCDHQTFENQIRQIFEQS